ncbi:MAG: MurR/RpiR family transcriptional regulator [Candidatus Bathyarchaeia archaeon]
MSEKDITRDIVTLIRENHDRLSRKQKIISKYLIEHQEEAPFLSARELAERTGTSESTVVRYAFTLGFDGYPDLQKALRERLTQYITTIERLSTAPKVNQDQLSIFQKLTSNDIENISLLRQNINENDLKAAVKMILSAKHIYILGLRISYTLAFALYYQLLTYITKNVSILTPNVEEMVDHLIDFSKEDLLIAISFPRYTKTVINALNYVKQKGTKIICITDNYTSPLVPFADLCFITSIKGMTLSESLVAPLSLIQALVEAVTLSRKEECFRFLQRKEDVWAQFDTFYERSY